MELHTLPGLQWSTGCRVVTISQRAHKETQSFFEKKSGFRLFLRVNKMNSDYFLPFIFVGIVLSGAKLENLWKRKK